MSLELLQKYKRYYTVRADKYAGNANYTNTFSAEKQLAEAVSSCKTLDEIREKIGNLNELCGIALIKDQFLMEREHYLKHHETVRAGAAQKILSEIDHYDQVADLISFVNEVLNEHNIAISLDESNSMLFFGDLDLLVEYGIYIRAVVPESYKVEMNETANDIRQSLSENVRTVEQTNQKWHQDWKVNPDICFEPRHMKKSPFGEEHLRELRTLFAELVKR